MYTEGRSTETGTLESSRYVIARIVQSTRGFARRGAYPSVYTHGDKYACCMDVCCRHNTT